MRVKYTKHNGDLYGCLADSGWIPVSLTSIAITQEWATLSYRRVGNIMYITGLIKVTGSSGANPVVANIPYKPAIEVDFLGGFRKLPFFINPSGEIRSRNGDTGDVEMINVSYPIS